MLPSNFVRKLAASKKEHEVEWLEGPSFKVYPHYPARNETL
jgi:hypothetical protein